jgi:phage tail sheath protein FI
MVCVEEVTRGPGPIDGVATDIVGMAGQTERGPAEPRPITSWAEYQQWFGGAVAGVFLPAAVHGFFENGGQRVVVARAMSGDPAAQQAALAALEAIDDIAFLLAPDEVTDSTGAITNAVIDQCERLKNRFAIVSAPRHAGRVNAITPPRDSSYATFYVPWLRVLDSAQKTAALTAPIQSRLSFPRANRTSSIRAA